MSDIRVESILSSICSPSNIDNRSFLFIFRIIKESGPTVLSENDPKIPKKQVVRLAPRAARVVVENAKMQGKSLARQGSDVGPYSILSCHYIFVDFLAITTQPSYFVRRKSAHCVFQAEITIQIFDVASEYSEHLSDKSNQVIVTF